MRKHLVLVGGGPSAAEIGCNTWRLTKDYGKNKLRIRIFSGKNIMLRFPDDVRKKISRSLKRRGIEILESGYVEKIKTLWHRLKGGRFNPLIPEGITS